MSVIKDPFQELEPDVSCPPQLKDELISEIDTIRNSLTVVELYASDFLKVTTTFLNAILTK
ncbi:hypothetical protein [Tellurirhabdus bombi]|uniref:hypothetical protein n=1 Tax=Tellurirhabdus bombi TaxID=2907205 RepID=UPI001F353929|nr:hypothetical protein [Tellurirhabdus bombi]